MKKNIFKFIMYIIIIFIIGVLIYIGFTMQGQKATIDYEPNSHLQNENSNEEKVYFYDNDFEYIVLQDGTVHITKYIGEKKEVNVPHKFKDKILTCIGTSAFANSNVEFVTLPSGLKVIKSNAFAGCKKLREIVLPSTLEEIGQEAFSNCINIKEIAIPENVRNKVGNALFKGCQNLEKVKLPSTLSVVPAEMFSKCKKIRVEEILTQGIEEIKERAFYDCNIKNLELPNGIKKIEDYAFAFNDELKKIKFVNSIEEFGEGVFVEAPFEKIVFPKNIKKIWDNTFSGSYLKKIKVSEGVSEIGENAFEDCIFLKTVLIPNSVKKIGCFAFSYSSVKHINLPNKIESIEDGTFEECNKLEKINIPKSVTKIGKRAFGCCNRLKKIELHDNIKVIEKRAFDGFCPDACSDVRQVYEPKFNEIKIPKNIEKIGDEAFRYNLNLNRVIFPSVINENCILGKEIFKQTSVEEVELPENLKEIPNGMFKNCRKLEKLVIPPGLEKKGTSAFEGCKNLNNIIFSKGTKKIIKDFCYGLPIKKVSIPSTVEEICDGAFQRCQKLTKINIPKSVAKIGHRAFASCTSLEKIVIQGSVKFIGQDAFNNCSNNLVLIVTNGAITQKFSELNGLKYKIN